jgi:hypothetical protein
VTRSKAAEISKRGRSHAATADTINGFMLYRLRQELARGLEITWPDRTWWDRPVEFFTQILGVTPWSRQVDILEAVRDHDRVCVRSGHKVSKSNSLAGIALCFYASFDDARVVMSSTTARQVDQILWRELSMMKARGGRCIACKAADPDGRRIPAPCPHSALIDGELKGLAKSGLKSGFREIVGFTAREAEAVAGISGANLLYLLDEASGIPEVIFDAIEGNRAGGARVVMYSNPTRTTGYFYDAFHSKSRFWKGIQISSEETPNVVEGRIVVPGLATRSWIDEKKDEWGEDSALYRIRVKGEFVTNESGRIFSVDAITQAQTRWTIRATNAVGEFHGVAPGPSVGRLFIGLDPAGATGMGDDTVFCMRRGPHVITFFHRRGLDDKGHLDRLEDLILQYAAPGETPVVVLDASGSIGASLGGLLRGHAERNPSAFRLLAVRGSDYARREPSCDRVRDELTLNLEKWMRAGGEIPADDKLAGEMHAMEWDILPGSGKQKVTPKTKLKRELGRSPDRYDALALACYEPQHMDEQAPERDERGIHDNVPGREFDPREGLRAFR